MYEYKPTVHHLLHFVDIKHLVQLLLECYYVLKFENLSVILGCLTDLVTWHYIALRRNDTGRLEVIYYYKWSMSIPPSSIEMSHHLSFLINYLP